MNTVPSHEDIVRIFDSITEHYENPVAIGTRCESNVFYRVEDLTEESLNLCANAVAARIFDLMGSDEPDVFLKLPGGFSFFGERLAAVYSEYWSKKEIAFEQILESKFFNGVTERFKGKTAVLMTDVITTARSSLELHTKATLRGIKVVCWTSLIDRTLGPGPVPVVSAFTGSPVRVLSGIT